MLDASKSFLLPHEWNILLKVQTFLMYTNQWLLLKLLMPDLSIFGFCLLTKKIKIGSLLYFLYFENAISEEKKSTFFHSKDELKYIS